ncbi:hypothetical protein C0995_008053 [Termitomyces sp. Mi166|nr:hypothetical protein C0995_008053 [Termitomyces sp. Mi166\
MPMTFRSPPLASVRLREAPASATSSPESVNFEFVGLALSTSAEPSITILSVFAACMDRHITVVGPRTSTSWVSLPYSEKIDFRTSRHVTNIFPQYFVVVVNVPRPKRKISRPTADATTPSPPPTSHNLTMALRCGENSRPDTSSSPAYEQYDYNIYVHAPRYEFFFGPVTYMFSSLFVALSLLT